jgi:DNA modification methylase
MNSSDLMIEKYLNKNGVKIHVSEYLKVVNYSNDDKLKYSDEIFDNIIVEGYNGFSEDVKVISNYVSDKYKLFFGRREKIIIKKILDYEKYELLETIDCSQIPKNTLINIIKKQRNLNFNKILNCKNDFFENLKNSISENNKNRVSDYINFLYSKTIIHYEFKKRSVSEIFSENEILLLKEINNEKLINFKRLCFENETKLEYSEAVELFNDLYQKHILDNGEKLNEIIAINLDQSIFNSFDSKEEFISFVYGLLRIVYNELQNHRTLILKISNIIYNGINIKWELYSYLTIYAENFMKHVEGRQYYKPEEICLDYLEHKFSLSPTIEINNKLKKYFKGTLEYYEISELVNLNIQKSEIDYFKEVYCGFQFIDCLILKSNENFQNSEEINFVENRNELILVFSKHEIDDRKIPCPVCASLKISGNSYPSIGIKSWECKNDLCSERSKTNRGKRYSSRSNDMQSGFSSVYEDNIISKDLISKWRKDIISESSSNTLFEMIIKYFSFKDGSVLFLNFNPKSYKIPKQLFNSRNIKFENINERYPNFQIDKSEFELFVNSEFLSKFIYNNDLNTISKKIDLNNLDKFKVINSDCLSYIETLPSNSIGHMVTSPPYYNAREYSQWKNLYNYLNDMYKICLASYDVLKPGGVFFYNIGDIFDNPNTIVKSKMGEKRLALGAYLILLFKSAGFELLDNIVWDKGETQSNRHKNDGNFTPYYQRPANCYEHIFIFKKKGKLSVCSLPSLKYNIQKFSPVIKINSKGENLFGHTAPYPPELPSLSINTFTNEGEIVFDPFLGSGTSVYTAVINNRKGLGTEMDKIYYELSKSNILKKIYQKDMKEYLLDL